ncbi:hypothetical protein Syun_024026 [Stephania yunnanensis]|uniref:Uncharacterized protein n=1 Tax=Stephania yunnanensis TaxID=152371 RepID=A0AAP0I3S3_9MAGN
MQIDGDKESRRRLEAYAVQLRSGAGAGAAKSSGAGEENQRGEWFCGREVVFRRRRAVFWCSEWRVPAEHIR